jgi:ParB/RepB/Spo0J family partition protein
MTKKRIPGTDRLFEETEALTAAFVDQQAGVARPVPIDRLVPSRFNPRKTYAPEDQEELVRSMRRHGFIGTLDGRELPDGRVELAYGSRRLLAAQAAGVRAIPVALHDWSDAHMCLVSLAENLARRDLPLSDEVAILRRVRDELGLGVEEIGQAIGKPASWVCERVADGAESVEAQELDPEQIAIDAFVEAAIAEGPQGTEPASLFVQDVTFGSPSVVRSGSPAARSASGAARGGARSGAAAPVKQTWVDRGSPMLVLAMEALNGFEPESLSSTDAAEAVDRLEALRDRAESLLRQVQG